jgi:hypothetical protein
MAIAATADATEVGVELDEEDDLPGTFTVARD